MYVCTMTFCSIYLLVQLNSYFAVKATLNRKDVYWLDAEKYHQDVRAIEEQENSWVGQVVVARSNTDGLYYPGKVACNRIKQFATCVSWNKAFDENRIDRMRGHCEPSQCSKPLYSENSLNVCLGWSLGGVHI